MTLDLYKGFKLIDGNSNLQSVRIKLVYLIFTELLTTNLYKCGSSLVEYITEVDSFEIKTFHNSGKIYVQAEFIIYAGDSRTLQHNTISCDIITVTHISRQRICFTIH